MRDTPRARNTDMAFYFTDDSAGFLAAYRARHLRSPRDLVPAGFAEHMCQL